MRRARSIDEVVTRGLCTGCGLCQSLVGAERLRMAVNKEGFVRPRAIAPLDAAAEHLVLDVCPGNVQRGVDVPGGQSSSAWGAMTGLFTAHALDEEVRFKGSSGGVVTAVAAFLLETGRARAVLQVGADSSAPLRSRARISRTKADLIAGAGSRYGPAAPLTKLHELLDAGEPFAVIGKPCDIAGLRNLSRIDPRIDALVVCAISFLCAGVSSLNVAHNIIGKYGLDENDVRLFRFRGHGCPGPTRIEARDGRSFEQTYDETWSNELNQTIQFRCKICPDSTGEQADIVCGDAWETGDGYAGGESEGINAVIARTGRGLAILQDMEAHHSVALSPLALSRFRRMQPHHEVRKRAVMARLAGLALAGEPVPRFHGMRLMRASGRTWKRWLYNLRGTLRRVRRGANRETSPGLPDIEPVL